MVIYEQLTEEQQRLYHEMRDEDGYIIDANGDDSYGSWRITDPTEVNEYGCGSADSLKEAIAEAESAIDAILIPIVLRLIPLPAVTAALDEV